MSFFIQAVVGIGYMRNACSIYAGSGTEADPWRAQPIGDPSSDFTFKDSDDGVGVFSTAIAVNPVGHSPYGDQVILKRKVLEFSAGFPADTVPIPNPPPNLGTVWGWFVFPSFDPTIVYGLVFIACSDGTEKAVFALADEILVFQKNPHFP